MKRLEQMLICMTIPIAIMLNNGDSIAYRQPREQIAAMQKSSYTREQIRELVCERTGAYLIGKSLDTLEKKIEQNPRILSDRTAKALKPNIPKNYLVENMQITMELRLSDKMLRVYQKHKNKKILLMETKVAVGGKAEDYSAGKERVYETPEGRLYIKRIVERPWWYPPKWAEDKKPCSPGADNPYGNWMAELSRDRKRADYGFSVTGDTNARLHSVETDRGFDKYNTHGCIAMKQNDAEELFRLISRYAKHQSSRKTSRGTIYPLSNPIVLDAKK
jgi:lipoprotein-anchoring transpeptidase ErfK/SrfK